MKLVNKKCKHLWNVCSNYKIVEIFKSAQIKIDYDFCWFCESVRHVRVTLFRERKKK